MAICFQAIGYAFITVINISKAFGSSQYLISTFSILIHHIVHGNMSENIAQLSKLFSYLKYNSWWVIYLHLSKLTTAKPEGVITFQYSAWKRGYDTIKK